MRKNLDTIINRWVSRKLFVFLIGCAGLFSGNLNSSDWVIVATAYISIQGVTDIVEKLSIKKNE